MAETAKRTPYFGRSGLEEFRHHLLTFLSVFTFYGAWFLLGWLTKPNVPVIPGASLSMVLLALAVGTFILRQRRPRLAAWGFVLGSIPLCGLILALYRQPASVGLFLFPTLISGLLLGKKWPPLVGLASVGGILYLHATTPLVPSPLFWIILLCGACGIGILASWALELIDYWETELTKRQEQLVEELRKRQRELNRTLKALNEAYSSLKRSNDELIIARQEAEEARALKEQFVANVSHELRTPLNLIVGFAEMMCLAPESYPGVVWTPTLRGDIEELYRASRHLQGLVNDILDLARIDAARMPLYRELQDIRGIIFEAVETIAPLLRQKGLTYEVQCPQELPPLLIDRTRIRQVMLNLLNNAARYTDEGGITVRVEPKEMEILVSVQDTGVGIPANQLEHIFEKFRQANAGLQKRGGAGLGLAISRQFIELHGGRMWAESQVGVGSTFYFSLPLPGATSQPTRLRRTPMRHQVDLSHASIVLVDADPSLADMLRRYLNDRPVIGIPSLENLEETIQKEHPLAVIVNLLPDAPEERWLEEISPLATRYGVPLIRCAIPSPSWLRQMSGLTDCLTKPIAPEMLHATLERYCSEPSTTLVVDDDPGFVRLMERMLNQEPLVKHVLTAYAGERAIELARIHQPNLIFLDLLMAEMDGFGTLKVLRQLPSLTNTPVIAVTGTSYAEEALHRTAPYFTITQASGFSSGTIVELLNAVLQFLQPNYALEESRAKV
ncbi:MAG: response regulator [Anaerolineae bacterium]|nr:response regulator [Anaerolineae bacterium]